MVKKMNMFFRGLSTFFLIFISALSVSAQNGNNSYSELLNNNYLSSWNGTQYEFVDKRETLEGLIDSLDEEIDRGSENPTLYLYRGLAYRHLTRAERLTELKSLSKYDYFSSKHYSSRVKSMVSDYSKAVELDRKDGKPASLTFEMLSASTNSTILPANINELLTRRKFEILKGDVPNEAINFYEDSYTSMYESYVGEEDFENALRIVDEMAEKFPNRADTLKTVREGILKRQEKIESLSGKRDPKSLSAQVITRLALKGELPDGTAEEQKPTATQTVADSPKPPTPVTQPAKSPADADVSEATEYQRWILILALLAIGLAVIVYIIRRPRK